MHGRAVFCLAVWTALWPTPVRSAEPLFCQLYAREWIKYQAGSLDRADAATITPEALSFMMTKAYYGCIAVDEPAPFPEGAIEPDDVFLAHVLAALHNQVSGAPPAGAPKAVAPPARPEGDAALVCGRRAPPEIASGTPERGKWCHRFFASFKKADGTVLCLGQRQRSPCG